ncbi:hypothetical protein D3C79_879350 [compost metagenome]
MLQPLTDFVRVGHRLAVARQDQAHAHQRLAQLGQQGQRDGVGRYAQANGATLVMQQQPRHFTGAVEDEGIRPRHMRLEQTEGAGVDLGVQPQLRHVTAHQGEVVRLVQPAQATHPLNRRLVTHLAAQRVGRVGRIHHHATLADDLDGLFYQARLWVLRMNLEKLAHVIVLFIAPKAVHG